MTDATNHDTREIEYAVMDAQIQSDNQDVRERQYCIQCHRSVDVDDYPWKFIAAGGVLEGPFCGKDCQFEWLMEDDDE